MGRRGALRARARHTRSKVLAVVEQDQQLFVSEVLDETVERGHVRSFADAEHTCTAPGVVPGLRAL